MAQNPPALFNKSLTTPPAHPLEYELQKQNLSLKKNWHLSVLVLFVLGMAFEGDPDFLTDFHLLHPVIDYRRAPYQEHALQVFYVVPGTGAVSFVP